MSLISIIVPCYNQAQYLDECLQSVLDQTYTDWECIIVNDGSPDYTEEVAKKWVEKDNRFKYLLKPNGGLSSARNAGIEIAIGEWILPLDSDDKISNKYLELAEKEFNKDYKLIYGKGIKFGDEDSVLELKEFSLSNLAFNNTFYASCFYNREDYKKLSGYNEDYIYGLEDWDFWIRLLEDGGKVFLIDEICFYYRIKTNSMLKNMQKKQWKLMTSLLIKNNRDFFDIYLDNQIILSNEKELINNKVNYYQKILESKRMFYVNKFFKIFDKFKK